jgi:beta-lactamase class A
MNRSYPIVLCLLILTFHTFTAFAQTENLKTTITRISGSIPADVGVAILDLQTGDTLSVNGNKHFPMQSVFKFHLALAVLNRVERGALSLDQKFHVQKYHYYNTWSVLMREHPDANIDVTLRELISWTVMNSDNVACDILFDLVGGPAAVDKFIHELGIKDIAITANERAMHAAWPVQFENWTTPNAAASLLKLFQDGRILKENNAFLWKLMTDTPNAPKRLKGLLPEGTVVARKPGTGSHNKDGVLGAANDIGIMVLPNGKKVIVAVLVTNTKETLPVVEKVIAEISKAVYDRYQE